MKFEIERGNEHTSVVKSMLKGCLHPCLEVNFVLNKEAMKHMIFLNRKRLFTDTVSVNKTHLTDTVSVNKKHATGWEGGRGTFP